MRSLRAFQTVCSSWATAWPTTRRAWTTRRTSRPCARKCPLCCARCWCWGWGWVTEVGGHLASRLSSVFGTSAKPPCLCLPRSGLGWGLPCPRGPCGLEWTEENPFLGVQSQPPQPDPRAHRCAPHWNRWTRAEGTRRAAGSSSRGFEALFLFLPCCANTST